MNNSKLLIIVAATMLLCACSFYSDEYGRMEHGFLGSRTGYEDNLIADKVYHIKAVRAYYSPEDYLNKRAEELCSGQKYELLNKNGKSDFTVTGIFILIPIEGVVSTIEADVKCL